MRLLKIANEDLRSKYLPLVQKFIDLNPEIIPMLEDKKSSAGKCYSVSGRLVAFLNQNNIPAQIISSRGFKEILEDAEENIMDFIHPDQKNKVYLCHAAVKTQDAIIDLTGSQFGKFEVL
jgi:hypothetical protein